MNFRAATFGGTDFRQRGDRDTVLELHRVDLAVTADGELERLGQGVDHRHTDTVQPP